MAENFVQGSEKNRALRSKNDRAAVPCQDAVHIPRASKVIIHMLQHVQTNHAVHGSSKALKGFGSNRVAGMNLDVRAMLETRLQSREMAAIDVRGDITITAEGKRPRQVAHASAHFEHAPSQERPDGIGHPEIKTRRHRKRIQNFGRWIFVKIGSQSTTDNDPQRLKSVLEADLLPFLIRSAFIADRHFINTRLPLRDLDGDLRLESEAVAVKWNAFQKRAAKRLVTRFHVGKIQTGHGVA